MRLVARAGATTKAERAAIAEVPPADVTAVDSRTEPYGAEPVGRFRRRMERFKGLAESAELPGSFDDEAELKLQLMLLREENARLKAGRHHPPGPGTMIDRLRVLSTPATDAEQTDEAWTLLADCLVIREGLEQACREIQLAIDGVRDRLEAIADRVDGSMSAERGAAGDGDIRTA